jgi:hypothetical protein
MATMTEASPVAHEIFCRPPLARGDGPEAKPRIEQYVASRDVNGQNVPTFHVTRCLECGATRYDNL